VKKKENISFVRPQLRLHDGMAQSSPLIIMAF